MTTTMSVNNQSMSFSFTASNNAGDPPQWQFDVNKYYTTDGTWITSPSPDFIVQPTQDTNIPWIIQDATSLPLIPTIGSLRLNSVTGMIEMWDGMNWQEYGKPLNPLKAAEAQDIPKPNEDFELGGAL